MKQRMVYAIMTAGGVMGMVSAFWQTLELLAHLENETAVLTCNINSVFSCTSVFDAWQSSVFGFPNSIMCLVLFTIFTAVGLVGLTNGKISRGMRLGTQFLTLFTLVFGVWFLWESTYVIDALCIFCSTCLLGLLLINWGWLRLNAADMPFGRQTLLVGVKKGADTFAWIVFGLVIAFAIALHFLNVGA